MTTNASEQPYPIRIASADELPRTLSPDGYFPLELPDLVYDDEVDDLPPCVAWQLFFAGGSNRPHWIRADPEEGHHMVECTDIGGSYDVYGPGYAEHFANAYDAFYYADRRIAEAWDLLR